MKKAVLALVIMLLLITLQSAPAQALSCERVTPEGEIKYADLIFQGIVIDEKDLEATFAVSKVWKGEVSHEITMPYSFWLRSDNIGFEPGNEYIVFASTENEFGEMSPRLCGNTGVVRAKVKAVLDQALPVKAVETVPQADAVEDAAGEKALYAPYVAGGVAVVALVAGGLFWWRTRKGRMN